MARACIVISDEQRYGRLALSPEAPTTLGRRIITAADLIGVTLAAVPARTAFEEAKFKRYLRIVIRRRMSGARGLPDRANLVVGSEVHLCMLR